MSQFERLLKAERSECLPGQSWPAFSLRYQVLLSEAAAFLLLCCRGPFSTGAFGIPLLVPSSHVRAHICLVSRRRSRLSRGSFALLLKSSCPPPPNQWSSRRNCGRLPLPFPSLSFVPPPSPFLLRVLRTIKRRSMALLPSRLSANSFQAPPEGDF